MAQGRDVQPGVTVLAHGLVRLQLSPPFVLKEDVF